MCHPQTPASPPCSSLIHPLTFSLPPPSESSPQTSSTALPRRWSSRASHYGSTRTILPFAVDGREDVEAVSEATAEEGLLGVRPDARVLGPREVGGRIGHPFRELKLMSRCCLVSLGMELVGLSSWICDEEGSWVRFVEGRK
ncbi:hypothetical protein NL676_025127 [Syzygium grande]|nr:hypothetical protein NL676_025127 [Syzygium grande]